MILRMRRVRVWEGHWLMLSNCTYWSARRRKRKNGGHLPRNCRKKTKAYIGNVLDASTVVMKRESCKEPEDRYAPPDATNTWALPNVYNWDTTRSSNPSSATIPRPPGLYKPVACASPDAGYHTYPQRRPASWHQTSCEAERQCHPCYSHSRQRQTLLLPSTRPRNPGAQRATHALRCA